MSTLPGGPADKAGIIHETLWGVYAMLKVLSGEADSICIEEPGVDGAEFHLFYGTTRQQWQAKRQVLSQANWSLKLLNSHGVLQFFLEQLRQGNSCVFASVSDAPELRVLAENALQVEKWEIFRDRFILAKQRRKDFDELVKHWGEIPEQEAFEYLRRIRVEGARETTLESLICCVLQATYTGPPQTILSVLHYLYINSVHQTLNLDKIQKYLEERDVRPRAFQAAAKLQDFVLGITHNYIAGQKSKLIQAKSIPREIVADIVSQLSTAEKSLDVLLTGSAGVGKSACLLQIVESLRATGIPVLAFRLDRIEPASSTEALGKKLELPESPALVLQKCFDKQVAVLVVDQLDFVSATSGRHPDFFDTLAALIDEVRGLRSSNRIHLILACRQFDFENDHRFRRLLPKGVNPIPVPHLSEVEVIEIIKAGNGDPSRLSVRQIDLLRLPQNLSLFTEAGLGLEKAPAFVSQKDLFDRYWETKRRAVMDQRPEEGAQWKDVIESLTQEMSANQELSVSKAKLDGFPPGLLGAMASQGVLTYDGRRYGFGHESFFDYCFARNLSANNLNFLNFLENDEQQLFRRAQLRQVLVYLRDDEYKRYLETIKEIFGSQKIRSHLKLLVLDLLAALPDPKEGEFDLLMPYLESELDCFRKQIRNTNKMASRAFQAFFMSRSLFLVADKLGIIEKLLNSKEEPIENTMAKYLQWQAEVHGDRVAELLQPFINETGLWQQRLRGIMEWTRLENSRRFFELFLRLIDNGTLDGAKQRVAQNGTFWSMMGLLAKSRPSWLAEVATHWLDRQAKIALDNGSNGISFDDPFGMEPLFESARLVPIEYAHQLLPTILRVAKTFARANKNNFLHDGVWSWRLRGAHGLAEALISSCEEALKIIGAQNPDSLRPFIDQLRPVRLYTANHLLLTIYLYAPKHYAEEAMALLSNEPDRLLCGFTDHAHWISISLIKQCSPYCTIETFQKLENAICNYSSPAERSKSDTEYIGHSAYNLASALDSSRRSPHLDEKLKGWQKKFLAPAAPPRGIRSYTVVSPISEKEAEQFTNEDWLIAISKYNRERGIPDINNPEKGGASHFAALLQTFLKKDPDRFARLSLEFPIGTHSSYFMNVLYGLQDVQVESSLKIEIVRRIYDSEYKACLTAALDLLSTIEDIVLPDDAVQFISDMAIKHPDPLPDESELVQESDIRIDGRNSVRGHAAIAIGTLVYQNKKYLLLLKNAIEHLVVDKSLAVKACVAHTLSCVAYHDTPYALQLFLRMVNSDDCLFATDYVQRFIAAGLSNHLEELRPCIKRMMSSPEKEINVIGGRFACLARLHHPEANELSEAAISGNASSRMGVAVVACENLLDPNCKEWCEQKLKILFYDNDVENRGKAAGCFWYLWQGRDVSLSQYNSLIQSFLGSPAFSEEPSYLIHALDDTRQRVPDTILDICEKFVEKCAEQARDIRTGLAGDEFTVGKLVMRAYAQLETVEYRRRTLNLIDRMCEEGLPSAGKYFAEFER